jgi:hypothetical protein
MSIALLLGVLRDEREPWIGSALCAQVDPEMFFGDAGARCDVRENCAAYILRIEAGLPAADWHGVFGGMSVADRRGLRETRAA